jgi:deazaflavin-dependent oxidoreductase (nitroreductase family)
VADLPARHLPMPAQRPLRYVDPHARQGLAHRAFVRLASSRFATWLATTSIWSAVVWRLDPLLLRLTRGRLGTGLMLPTALLQTLGARTGLVRRNAVIYFHDGGRVTIVASKAGRPGNPSWFYNALAHPDVLLGGQPFRAEPVTEEAERARLWGLADRVFPAFATYRRTAGRSIPILQLVPRHGIEDGLDGG